MSPSSSPLKLNVYPFYKAQVSSLIVKKTPIKVLAKYSDFIDVFSLNLVSEFLKHIGINDYAIKLVDSQQPFYWSIYSLRPVELVTLKAYFKTNLANGFIRPSRSSIGIFILFDQKSNSFLQLCVNYQDFNNLTIKNQYLLPLIGELLNRLGRAKQFS